MIRIEHSGENILLSFFSRTHLFISINEAHFSTEQLKNLLENHRMSLLSLDQQITIYGGLFLLIIGVIGNGINILVFSTFRNYRTTLCTFYFLIASVFNIAYITINLISRIVGVGFGIDLTRTSISWCKIRESRSSVGHDDPNSSYAACDLHMVPYSIFIGYLLITSAVGKDINRLIIENFILTILTLITYFYYTVMFICIFRENKRGVYSRRVVTCFGFPQVVFVGQQKRDYSSVFEPIELLHFTDLQVP